MLEFNPPAFVKNRHLQSMISPLTRKFPNLPPFTPVHLQSGDGTPLFGKQWNAEVRDSIVILYHGLGGHEDAPYVLGASLELFKSGFSVLRMRLRGAEPESPATPQMYHAGLTEDIQPAVDWARGVGYRKIFIVGFSLTANTVLKWLGEGRREIDAAFAVSPPVRLSQCARMIDSKRNWIYQGYFLSKLKAAMKLKAKEFPELFSKYVNPKFFRSIRAFDENVTSQFHRFGSAERYYEHASCVPFLSNIQNRVTIVHSIDDPFVDSEDLIAYAKSHPSNVQVKLFDQGGHVGFYEGPFRGYRADRWIVEAFS